MSPYLPEDLASTTTPSVPDRTFEIVINDLQLSTPYNFQFAWIIPDQPKRVWSATKQIITPGESAPNTPSGFVVENNTPGYLKITWDGKDDSGSPLTSVARVDIYIDGLPFDGTKPADYFLAAGTKTITAPAGTYIITGYSVSKLGTISPVAAPVTRTVLGVGTPVIAPVDPSAPTLTTGLASIIVSWDGKTSAGASFADGSFAGAKVYVGTTSTFTPSDNNWVHSLNFANGSNQVSIGVGTVIDKSATPKTKLAYDTDYYVKLGTVNAKGETTGTFIAASPAFISVSKLPASEISTGILNADASITAGAETGARVVLSGGADPFSIYGTDGTTKLLNFYLGDEDNDATLSIVGSGTFTGDISGATGTLKNSLTVGTAYNDASVTPSVIRYPFSVSSNGVMWAESGTIGGWTLGNNYLINSSNTFRIQSTTDTTQAKYKAGVILGAVTSPYLELTADGIIHRNADGTESGKFSLTTSTGLLTMSGTLSGGTVQGGIIQTTTSPTNNNYIKMDSSEPGTIKFITSSDQDSDGYIKMSTASGVYTSMEIAPPMINNTSFVRPYIDAYGFLDIADQPVTHIGIHATGITLDGPTRFQLSEVSSAGSGRTLIQEGFGNVSYGRKFYTTGSSSGPSNTVGIDGDIAFSVV